ncbi:STAS domain-containing protein [Halonatronum saccharophilum]|uniref:STAS domain-containing protein n=1 Tax=Halonatronum saccharophilum TaxID=150060 RepID=UPI000487F194|nr:anti-sigma factor antagonist [Halonatronum saccharophilum]
MDLSFKEKEGKLIVSLKGDFDLHTAPGFKEAITKKINPQIRGLILNLDGIKFIDSSGLGAILVSYKKIKGLGGELGLLNVTPQVRRIFELSGMLKIINLYSSEKEALDNIFRG